MNNPFGEDIFMGKSTEITDLVMHPNQFENIMTTNNLNTINNNLINNGTHDDDNFMQVENTQSFQPQTEGNNPFTLNDDNNNSNNNFNNSDLGPETNVDPDDDFSQNEELGEAAGGEKEKIQTEPKETDDLIEQVFTGYVDYAGACEDFTGGCDDEPNEDEETENVNESKPVEEKQVQQMENYELNKEASEIDGYGNQMQQIATEMGFDFTSCETEEDACDKLNEMEMQSTLEAI